MWKRHTTTIYFRDYDPTTGRYVQSDPIGLGGESIRMHMYTGILLDSLIRMDYSFHHLTLKRVERRLEK